MRTSSGRARDGKLQVADFQGTTISLTNPGTIGTVASTPRLMAGQSRDHRDRRDRVPAEYQAMTPEALSQLGISKAITISSTYDHRIVQGAESGAFLARIHELLLGKHDFTRDLCRPRDQLPAAALGSRSQSRRFSASSASASRSRSRRKIIELINAYRVRGHLIADIDPLT